MINTLFPWSNGDGEWGVGNIEVVLPSKIPGEEVGDPQAGDVDKRPIWKIGKKIIFHSALYINKFL